MAELFLARVPTGDGGQRHVVLKRVLRECAIDPERGPRLTQMFLDEAALASQLDHPNVAKVFEIGRLGESYFFTMEYVHGEDVRTVLGKLGAVERRLPISHVLHIAAGVAAGLHYAHERTAPGGAALNIVHRDVSPANVMVSFEGDVKLVDFGVAKAAGQRAQTQVGALKGKLAYLSPEQCRGQRVDRRSDIFAFGIFLHELLTGARLFRRDSDYDTMQAIVEEDVAPPSRLRPEVTPSLDRIVMTALAKDPAQRYATAAQIVRAIDAVVLRDGWTPSAPGLGRFLRELFGARREPWFEVGESIEVTGTTVEEPGTHDTIEELAVNDPRIERQLKDSVALRPQRREGEDSMPT